MIAGKGVRQSDGSLKAITSIDKVGQEFKIADSVFRLPPHQSRGGIESGHPAVYPIALAKQLTLSYSETGDTILDPFMGSGTTGVGCVKLGRKFIGIEIEPKYFDIAVRRIEEAYRQPDLFVAPPAPKPVQLSLMETP
jgi:DNA modification methylase